MPQQPPTTHSRGNRGRNAYANMIPALLETGAIDAAAQAIGAGRALRLRVFGTAFPLLMSLPPYVLGRGDTPLAAQLLGAAEQAYQAGGQDLHPPERRARDRALAELQSRLGEAEIAALRATGATWSEDEAFDNAGVG